MAAIIGLSVFWFLLLVVMMYFIITWFAAGRPISEWSLNETIMAAVALHALLSSGSTVTVKRD